jgi:hypothetical protein
MVIKVMGIATPFNGETARLLLAIGNVEFEVIASRVLQIVTPL